MLGCLTRSPHLTQDASNAEREVQAVAEAFGTGMGFINAWVSPCFLLASSKAPRIILVSKRERVFLFVFRGPTQMVVFLFGFPFKSTKNRYPQEDTRMLRDDWQE